MKARNSARQDRLAAALRENLKRRKAGARAKAKDGATAKPEPQAADGTLSPPGPNKAKKSE